LGSFGVLEEFAEPVESGFQHLSVLRDPSGFYIQPARA
jgi:hypothetical protein